jgi:hypothetical protein
VRRLTTLRSSRVATVLARAALAAGALGCASPAFPPGGPEDRAPAQLVSITPDSMTTGVSPRTVVFRFDEVVSERPQTGASLASLFLISPRDGAPLVDWRRSALTVRQRRGWRPNTTYTVTMLPGLADLRGNVRRDGAVAVFSTGPALDTGTVSGQVFDWVAGRPAPRALVEAIRLPDSTTYLAQADSTGRFALSYLAPGRYVVRGFADVNANRGLEPREPWDSVVVEVPAAAAVELLAFIHDTVGPRIQTVAVTDSMTLRLTFDRPIDPGQPIAAELFTLRDADSTPVRLARALAARDWDRELSARRDSAARTARDSAAAADTGGLPIRRDTPAARADTAARGDSLGVERGPSRPSPIVDVVLRTATPLRPATSYRVSARGIRGLLGAERTSDRAFSTPRAAAPADTAARARADTVPRPPAGAPPRP